MFYVLRIRFVRQDLASVIEGVSRGGARRELKKRGRGMKDHVEKSMRIVTLIQDALVKINPTDPLRFSKRHGSS